MDSRTIDEAHVSQSQRYVASSWWQHRHAKPQGAEPLRMTAPASGDAPARSIKPIAGASASSLGFDHGHKIDIDRWINEGGYNPRLVS
jgi:hypothetical protein